MPTSMDRTVGTLSWSDSKKIFVGHIILEMYILAFLFLFLSDITPFPPRALSVYASIPLAFLGILYFPRATPTLRFFCVTFVLSAVYQQIISGEVFFKPILAIFATFFITIYYQQMGEEGLERLKKSLALFFIVSFALFIGTMLSDTVLRFREGLYLGVIIDDPSLGVIPLQGTGGLAITRFYLGYQVAAGICLFIGEVFKRGINKSILQIGLMAFSALTLVLCGERSVLVAVAITILVISFIIGKPWKIILLSLILISLYIPLKVITGYIGKQEQETVIYKVMDEKRQAGALERIEVQLWALSQIPFYPLGITEEGISYDTLVRGGNFEHPIAPHNGYITRPLYKGWFLIFIAIIVFQKVIKVIFVTKHRNLFIILPVLGGLIGALANALFHNPSFLTFSSETMILLMLLGSYFDYNLEKRFQYSSRHSRMLINSLSRNPNNR